MKKVKKFKNGFTLIEIMIVVAILGILAAIAIPIYNGYITAAKRSEAKTNLQQLRLLLEQYYSENGKYCPDASCNGQTYEYKEDDNGNVTTDDITAFLPGFKPKSAASAKAVLYNYTIATTTTGYTITATPVTSRGAPSGNLTIDQDGNKTGNW